MKTTKSVYLGQKLMEQFVRKDNQLEQEINNIYSSIDEKQKDIKSSIELLKKYKR